MEFKFPPNIPSMDIKEFIEDPSQRKWEGSFTFVHAADTQLGMMGSYKLNQDVPTWEYEMEQLKKAIHQINKLNPKPRFMVISGDMLDALPFDTPPLYYKSATKTNLEYREMQYKDFVPLLKDLDPSIKLVCVCGNHDVGDRPTRGSIEMYRKNFGTDFFSFWVGGVKFIVLNSQHFFAPDAVPEERDKQLDFMKTIPDPAAKFIVVLQHIPFYAKNIEETDSYYNIPKVYRVETLEKLNGLGVTHIFCGHFHESAQGKYKSMEFAVTSSLGAPMGETPSGFRLVKVNKDGISHQYIPIVSDDAALVDAPERCSCMGKNKCTISYPELCSV